MSRTRSPLPSIVLATCALLVATPLPCAGQRPEPHTGRFADRVAAWQRHQAMRNASPFRGLRWRSVGPVVQGGRVVDIEGVPGQPFTLYVAYASGGLWRTRNNGQTFEPLFDDQPCIIMGDIAVAPSRPTTIYVGTGENNSSRSSYGGYGVFRSDDGGDSWRHLGLGESDRIGRIAVDPRDPERVYVAALGRLYTPGGQRGVYRSTDGGASWRQVLPGGSHTGAVDLVLDPADPDVIYAATWERSRRPWNFVEGGAGSAIWKSTDGGESWHRLLAGLPSGPHVGRIGLAVTPARPGTVYACVDNQEVLPEEFWDLGDEAITAKRLRTMTREEFLARSDDEIESFIRGSDLPVEFDASLLRARIEAGDLSLQDLLAELTDANAQLFQADIRGLEVYRSDDAGEHWRRTHADPLRRVVHTYGYYFGQIRCAPDDADLIYTYGVPLLTSDDGGATFHSLQAPDVHVDHHALWIDPEHPRHIVDGNDGGLDVTYDGGSSWSKLDAQPVGQFYTLALDMAEPFNIYGGLQDNGTLVGSSRTRPGRDAWSFVGGGDGMAVQIDPRDGTVYSGYQFGWYGRGGPDGRREVRPRDAIGEPALRYNWSTPLVLSPHDPDIVYFGASRLYRSMDRGESWSAISPDLSRSKERGDVPFACLTTVAESELEFGLIWTGTDDGLVHVTEDGGRTWREATAGLPHSRWVSRVEPSRVDRDRVYVALNGYRDDDATAYLYASDDLGHSWRSIAAGLPAEPVNTVREDPIAADVIYVGTDRGVYVSIDRGGHWESLAAGLPPVPVHDLALHPRDRELVAATHGRSVYVIDALPIEEATPSLREELVHVFPLEPLRARRSWWSRPSRWYPDPDSEPRLEIPLWAGRPGELEVRLLDSEDRPLWNRTLHVERGVHTITWDLFLDREAALTAEDGAAREATEEKAAALRRWREIVRLGGSLRVTPGCYRVEARLGGGTHATDFEVQAPEPFEPRKKPTPPVRGRGKGRRAGA